MILLAIGMVAFVIFAAVGCALAIILGEGEERRAAWGYLAAVAATQAASLLGPRWHGPEYGVMLVDAIYAVALMALAEGSKKWWPIWAAACQIAGTLSHLAPVAVADLPKELYLTIQPLWGFLVLATILAGVRTSRRARTR